MLLALFAFYLYVSVILLLCRFVFKRIANIVCFDKTFPMVSAICSEQAVLTAPLLLAVFGYYTSGF